MVTIPLDKHKESRRKPVDSPVGLIKFSSGFSPNFPRSLCAVSRGSPVHLRRYFEFSGQSPVGLWRVFGQSLRDCLAYLRWVFWLSPIGLRAVSVGLRTVIVIIVIVTIMRALHFESS